MREDLQPRNYFPHPGRCYLRCVTNFVQHCGTRPEHVGPEHIRAYPLFLVTDQQASWASVTQTVCALRFFDRVTLGQPWMAASLPLLKRPHTLPVVLSQVAALL